MTTQEYQEFVKKSTTQEMNKDMYYPVLGICGEVGEIAEKFKKLKRDHNNILTEEYKNEIIKELGDVLWYITRISENLNSSLQEVMDNNVNKINLRLQSNTIKGDGDNR